MRKRCAQRFFSFVRSVGMENSRYERGNKSERSEIQTGILDFGQHLKSNRRPEYLRILSIRGAVTGPQPVTKQ